MDATTLPPDHVPCVAVHDGLGAAVEIAQTARREADSGLFSVLEDAEGGEPAGREGEQAPRSWQIQALRGHQKQRARHSPRQAAQKAQPPLPRPDVGHARRLARRAHPIPSADICS